MKATIYSICMLMVFSVSAGDMYKWQDKDGIWHFSSTPPETDENFDTMEMPADPKPLVSMRKLGTEREPEYSFINNIWGPVELELRLHDAENVSPEPPLPARLVLPGQSRTTPAKNQGHGTWQGLQFPSLLQTDDRPAPRSIAG